MVHISIERTQFRTISTLNPGVHPIHRCTFGILDAPILAVIDLPLPKISNRCSISFCALKINRRNSGGGLRLQLFPIHKR